MLGSALFGGHPAYEHSYIEIKLATEDAPLVKEHLTVMLWFRSGDVRGVRTLVDLSSAEDPTVHKSSLNLDDGAPLLKLHDAAKKDKLFYALQRYAVSGTQFNRCFFGLCFGLKNGSRFLFAGLGKILLKCIQDADKDTVSSVSF